jgi:CheY-like chemotaxis protein
MMRTKRTIMLVEDDSVDAMTVVRALKEIKVSNPLYVAANGEEGLEYLNANPAPGLILLDLNMPRMGGLEFLQTIKADQKFRKIPVVVLTTSTAMQDREASFECSAAGYMIKPVEYRKFVEIIRVIDSYWSTSETFD